MSAIGQSTAVGMAQNRFPAEPLDDSPWGRGNSSPFRSRC